MCSKGPQNLPKPHSLECEIEVDSLWPLGGQPINPTKEWEKVDNPFNSPKDIFFLQGEWESSLKCEFWKVALVAILELLWCLGVIWGPEVGGKKKQEGGMRWGRRRMTRTGMACSQYWCRKGLHPSPSTSENTPYNSKGWDVWKTDFHAVVALLLVKSLLQTFQPY